MIEKQDAGVNKGNLTEVEHWDKAWLKSPHARLPSSLLVGTLNIKRLLRRHVKPGARFLEIGCAPGKMLVWVERARRAIVAGVHYSRSGEARAYPSRRISVAMVRLGSRFSSLIAKAAFYA